jgi:4-amino-4-deoxy-L-arabinose transferase-like glycosyltransferase
VSRTRWLFAILAGALALHLTGIGYGLPSLFNGDEPHIVDTAVYFGGAHTLRPPLLKYPDLYMYLLSVLYGLWFLAARLTGFVKSTTDFAAIFIWNPTGFYVIGRLVSTLAAVGAAWLGYRAGEEAGEPTAGLWSAALLAVSPALNDASHAAKPESLLLLFAAAAQLFALRWLRNGRRKWAVATGAMIGLACASQYTAAPLLFLPLAVALMRRSSASSAIASYAAAGVAGFLASPFVLIDFPRFWADVHDLGTQLHSAGMGSYYGTVLLHIAFFAGWGGALGLAWGLFRRADLRLFALATIVPYALVLGHTALGWERHLFGAYPAIALMAGLGFADLGRKAKWAPAALSLCLVPGLVASAQLDARLLRPDTRNVATRWIEDHIPPGTTLLLDAPEVGPQLRMSRGQAEELFKKAEAAGHPRARFYKLMVETHPGGGYRLLHIRRDAADLGTQPAHLAWSQKAQDLVDVSSGAAGAKEADVDYIVTSSFGVKPETPGFSRWFADLAKLETMKTFRPGEGETGPELTLLHLRP